jgi:aldehyde dehydrogenase (NAD+)
LGRARIRHEPLGVALIIGAWNFPVILLLQPVVAAIAAGCAIIMKPSDLSIATQDLVCELVPKYLDTSAIAAVSAGPQEMTRILEYKFEHIFYTGGSKVARIVTAAAAKHLTPTVLELGGQGPAIVTASANVDLAAKRIAYAKFVNAGQICISVNHVFADPAIYDEFVKRLSYWNDHFQGGEKKGANMVRIVNERNFNRLVGSLERTKGDKAYGGEIDKTTLQIKPTIVTNIQLDDPLMEEELFGPICPVIKTPFREAVKAVSNLPHPLAIYIFSSVNSEIDEILANTNSGGVSVNDVFIHILAPNAPFGGVGESGSGYYHGMYGVRAFQHLRTVVAPPTWLERLLAFRYPPYGTGDGDSKAKMVHVKNNLGFKRGETMEDQRIGGGWFGWLTG